MKNKFSKIILTSVLLVLTSNLISLNAYADPSSSQGFAGYDDVTAEIKANEEIKNQEISEEEKETVQSSNNYLEKLEINGHKLIPEFDKQTINYEIENVDTEEIEVTAIAEDSRAIVSGTGKITLNSGENDVKIEVAAENGSVRTYHIKIIKNGKRTESINEIQNEEVLTQNQETIIKNEEANTKNAIICIFAAVLIIAIIIIVAKKHKNRK